MKLYIQTHGCQMNENDSARIIHLMRRLDYTPTDKAEEADLILLNTCSVRDKAEQKVYSALGRWRELKQKKTGLVIGVGGCVAQQQGENLLRRAPYVDLVFGTQNIHKLPQMVENARTLGKQSVERAFYRQAFFLEDPDGMPAVHGPKAYVTIMQGCNKVCSFCIVPHVRGRETSRSSKSILNEINTLVAGGVKEVMLLGQNVNSYGKTSPAELTFAELLRRISDIEGLERIRFTTSHPQDLSADLIAAYRSLGKLGDHLHLPVQSGSDGVLKRMRRGYTCGEYEERIQRLRECRPTIALTTDIIVGFPGETEEEFEQTLEILQRLEYDDIYSFAYSPRPHTIAANMYPDDVPEDEKKSRLSRVQSLQSAISLKKNRERVGSLENILVEGCSKLGRGQITGRTTSNKVVNVVGSERWIGKTIQVRIVGASANSLLGELVPQCSRSDVKGGWLQ